MESMIQDMLPVDLPSGADGVEPKPRGERHSWVTVEEVTALWMGARRLMTRHFQRQRNWAHRRERSLETDGEEVK